MRNILKRFVILSLVLNLVLPCSANSVITIAYNGENLYLEQEAKQIGGSILLPIRALSQYFGYTVTWDSALKQIDIMEENRKITLFIDDMKAYVNGKEARLSIPAQMIEGTTYVPLRFIGEALDMSVDWDSQTQTVNLEGKYTLDRENKQLLVRTKEGKKVLSEVTTLQDDENTLSVSIRYITTKNGSEIVTISEAIQGALTGRTSTAFYIKDGKIIDKIERPHHYIGEKGIAYLGDKIAFGYGRYLRIYNDQTGEMIKNYDLNDFQEGLTLDLMKIGENYAMGRHDNMIHVVDFQTGKVTRIFDLVSKEDQDYVFEWDMYLTTDKLQLVWETDNALVFKYPSIITGTEKTVTCKLGF